MHKAILVLFVLAITMALSGCLVTTRPHRGHSHHKSRACHPSQYWDGHRCVHKKHKHKHKHKKHHKKPKRKKHKTHDHRGH